MLLLLVVWNNYPNWQERDLTREVRIVTDTRFVIHRKCFFLYCAMSGQLVSCLVFKQGIWQGNLFNNLSKYPLIRWNIIQGTKWLWVITLRSGNRLVKSIKLFKCLLPPLRFAFSPSFGCSRQQDFYIRENSTCEHFILPSCVLCPATQMFEASQTQEDERWIETVFFLALLCSGDFPLSKFLKKWKFQPLKCLSFFALKDSKIVRIP